MNNNLNFWSNCTRKSTTSRLNIRIWYNIVQNLRAGGSFFPQHFATMFNNHKMQAQQPFSSPTVASEQHDAIQPQDMFCSECWLAFFLRVEKIILLLLLLNFCHSFTLAVSYTTAHSGGEQVQACSLVAVRMHFTQRRKTLTKAAVAGEMKTTKLM